MVLVNRPFSITWELISREIVIPCDIPLAGALLVKVFVTVNEPSLFCVVVVVPIPAGNGSTLIPFLWYKSPSGMFSDQTSPFLKLETCHVKLIEGCDNEIVSWSAVSDQSCWVSLLSAWGVTATGVVTFTGCLPPYWYFDLPLTDYGSEPRHYYLAAELLILCFQLD